MLGGLTRLRFYGGLCLPNQVQYLPIDRSIVVFGPLRKPLIKIVRYAKRQALVWHSDSFLHKSIIREMRANGCITCAARILMVKYVQRVGGQRDTGSSSINQASLMQRTVHQ